ncbi:hypothetical protein CR513_16830, partial [Mucuna pruriens]
MARQPGADEHSLKAPRSGRHNGPYQDTKGNPRISRTVKKKLTAPYRYHMRSWTKNMEQAIEELEQLNAETRVEMRLEMGQMKEQINRMFEILTRNTTPTPIATAPVAPSTATSGTPTHPLGFTPPAWNATAENPQAPQGQPARNASGPGPGQGMETGPLPTSGAILYHHPPSESGHVPGPVPEPTILGSDKINALEERMRAIEGTSSHGIDAANLCLVPNIELPPDFKVPKFEKYKGSSCPHDNLTGAALRWYVGLDSGRVKTWRDLADAFLRQYKYNKDMAPNRSRLQNLSKTDVESFKDYAQRWRELAAKVQPPLSEREMASMFIDTLPTPFYDKVVGSVASNFADLVIIGERIEAGIKRGRFTQDRGSTSFVKKIEKRRGDTNAVIADPPHPQGQAKLILSGTGIASPSDMLPQADKANAPETQNPRLTRQRRTFTPIPMPYTTLFPLLLQKDMIAILPLKPLEPPYPWSYDPQAKCEYHVGTGTKPNIGTNPLPTHEGQAINTLSHSALTPDRKEEEVAMVGQPGVSFQPLVIQCNPVCPTLLVIAVPPRPAYKDNHAVP